MKVVRSRRPVERVDIPLRGGGPYLASFATGRALLPEHAADALVAAAPSFYSVEHADVAGALRVRADRTERGELGPPRVLVIRDMGMGDVLLTTPLLRRLAQDYGARVTVQTAARYQCLFDGNPHVEATLPLEGSAPDCDAFDFVFDLRLLVEKSERGGAHVHRADAFALLAGLGLTEAERRPDYRVTPEEAEAASARIADLRGEAARGVVAYAWRSSCSNQNWSAVAHYRALRALLDAGYGVAVLDHEIQSVGALGFARVPLLDATGELSIRETAALVAACDALVTPDTGLFHLAAALDVPTVAYFGAFPAAERQAHRTLHVVNDAARCPLAACRMYHCFNRGEHGQPRCLDVEPAALVAAVAAVIEERSKEDDGRGAALGVGRPAAPAGPDAGGAAAGDGPRRGRRRRAEPAPAVGAGAAAPGPVAG